MRMRPPAVRHASVMREGSGSAATVETMPDTRINLNLPPEQEAGHYANFAGGWHGADGFVSDFAVVPQLIEQFRPEVPEGIGGWGAKGELRLEHVRRAVPQDGAGES